MTSSEGARVNVVRVLNALLANYGGDLKEDWEWSSLRGLDLLMYEAIKGVINKTLEAETFDYEYETKLTYNSDEKETFSDDEPSSSFQNKYSRTEFFKYKEAAVQYWNSGSRGRKSFKAVQRRYRRLNSRKDLYIWEKQVKDGGNRREKWDMIARSCKEKFDNACENLTTVHDINIKQWAMQSARELQLDDFKASDAWVNSFKKTHNIVSRKITTITTTKKVSEEAETVAKALEFVEAVKEEIKEKGPERVLNSDQSGFQLEMHPGRTLSIKGSKTVVSKVQSESATTHSYTIMPTVSAAGELLSPLLIVLKETSGVFGPRVKESLFQHKGIRVLCTKSGKMGSKEVSDWFENTLLPNYEAGTITILLDSFSGHKCLQNMAAHVNVKIIPPGATGYCQPLDVYGFRFWKNFIRRLSNSLLLLKPEIRLSQRNTILKMQSLIHFLLSSPRFRPVWQYAWYRAGYIDQKPPFFENVVNWCFDSNDLICNQCPSPRMLTCSYCKACLCVEHFYIAHHTCYEYIP